MKRKSTNLGVCRASGAMKLGIASFQFIYSGVRVPGNPAGKRPGAKSCTERDSSIDQYKETIAEFVY